MALDVGAIDLHDVIRVRLPGKALGPKAVEDPRGSTLPTFAFRWSRATVGRVLFNEAFPANFEYVNGSRAAR